MRALAEDVIVGAVPVGVCAGIESMLNGPLIFPWPQAQGRNWHLTATAESRGCRGFVGPVPQPLWIKESVFSCRPNYIKGPRADARTHIHVSTYLDNDLAVGVTTPDRLPAGYAEHSPSM